ncbi:MAG: hypothetical protein WBH97_01720 [Rectinemataceae bacterium]
MDNVVKNDDELSNLLTELWENTIIPLYEKGKIQTERHLQSYLFMLLKNRFEEKVPKDWDVWVEPQFYLWDESAGKEKMYKPDLVITKDYKIAGIIELKFSPQEWNPEKNLEAARSDVKKLILYEEGISKYPKSNPSGELFLLELLPNQGSYDDTKLYHRVANTLHFFLGIAHYTGDVATELRQKVKDKLGGKFICLLHATDPHDWRAE